MDHGQVLIPGVYYEEPTPLYETFDITQNVDGSVFRGNGRIEDGHVYISGILHEVVEEEE